MSFKSVSSGSQDGFRSALKEAAHLIFEETSYKLYEIEAVCWNPLMGGTPAEQYLALYDDLSRSNGPEFFAYIQDFFSWIEDEDTPQASLAVIIFNPRARKKVLAAFKKHGVEVDLENHMRDWKIKEVLRSEAEHQWHGEKKLREMMFEIEKKIKDR